ESQNVEDRRSQGGRGGLLGGGRSLGVGTLLLILAGAYFGIDPRLILAVLEPAGAPTREMRREAPRPPANDQEAQFVSLVLQDTEVTFSDLFQRHGLRYQDPKLVLFSGATPTACGMGQSAMGPFYCPPDQKVYIDLRFYDDLKKRFGAPGDFAQAYVVAHEVGHHVQNLLGIQDKVQGMKARMRPVEANQLSVRMELQADCFAGVWAHNAQKAREVLEAGDVEEGLRAASAIGDDRLQRQSQGVVVPESFTHGTSAQRVAWFKNGLTQGTLEACDTFAAEKL
ncbi:MAG: hypothetical protein D4R76_10930, partial [Methylococcus sp.]